MHIRFIEILRNQKNITIGNVLKVMRTSFKQCRKSCCIKGNVNKFVLTSTGHLSVDGLKCGLAESHTHTHIELGEFK